MPTKPVPQSVVQFIPIDRHGRFLTLQRGPNVRSAANCRSFPSGMHDIGMTQAEVIEKEAMEELGLVVKECQLYGIYENVAGDDPSEEQYHWVIAVYFALVDNLEDAQNLEPDKHSDFSLHNLKALGDADWYSRKPFHDSFMLFAERHSMFMSLEAQAFLRKAEINETLKLQ